MNSSEEAAIENFHPVWFLRISLRRYLLIFFLLLLSAKISFASEPLTLHSFSVHQLSLSHDSSHHKIRGNVYFDIGLLFPKQSYKDYVVSPNTYTSENVFPLVKFGLEKKYPKYSGYTNLLAGSQKLNDVPGFQFGDLPTMLLTIKLNTSRTYKLSEIIHHRVIYQLGYSANAEYTQRVNDKFQNAAYTFDLWANAGVANRVEFPFTIKTEKKLLFIRFQQPQQRFSLNWQINIPLIGLITRPNYAGIGHFANGEFYSNLFREMGDNLQFVSVNKFIMVQSQLELLAPLGNNNKLEVAYQWQGFRYNND